jgi:hypothetical protein
MEGQLTNRHRAGNRDCNKHDSPSLDIGYYRTSDRDQFHVQEFTLSVLVNPLTKHNAGGSPGRTLLFETSARPATPTFRISPQSSTSSNAEQFRRRHELTSSCSACVRSLQGKEASVRQASSHMHLVLKVRSCRLDIRTCSSSMPALCSAWLF